MAPADSQLRHHQDPNVFSAPHDVVVQRIEALNEAGSFWAAEAYLTQNAARRMYEDHRAQPGLFTRVLDRFLGQ